MGAVLGLSLSTHPVTLPHPTSLLCGAFCSFSHVCIHTQYTHKCQHTHTLTQSGVESQFCSAVLLMFNFVVGIVFFEPPFSPCSQACTYSDVFILYCEISARKNVSFSSFLCNSQKEASGLLCVQKNRDTLPTCSEIQ